MTYDSTEDTKTHISRVQVHIAHMQANLDERAAVHDRSKLQEPEKSVFDEFTPKLKDSTYGSDEYKQFLTEMGVALQHHYAHNDHHPEFYENGVDGMSLMALLEHLADCRAATERHADGNLAKSLDINKVRFGYSDQTYNILVNTAKELGWL
jgi:hypothetical protein